VNRRLFAAGDTVYHAPTGETWLLIVDEHDGQVVPGGWPDTRAKAEDCTLLEGSVDREARLRETAASQHSAAGLAKLQLEGGK
jgi:hypothetical protein